MGMAPGLVLLMTIPPPPHCTTSNMWLLQWARRLFWSTTASDAWPPDISVLLPLKVGGQVVRCRLYAGKPCCWNHHCS